ncbi:MAG: hypothetical protein IJD38_01560 [Clostridia bacterium]|nr:hypothetical protein [Clostridia bacterium]
MKKRTLLILVALVCLLLLIVFELHIQSKMSNSYDPLNFLMGIFASSSTFLFAAVAAVAAHDEINLRSRRETPSDYVMVKGFRVLEKKCTYDGEGMVLLCLANCAKNVYTVTVTVTYLNAADQAIGREKQTVTGFTGGMEKYLCFRPGRDFHAFSYTLETSLFRGVSTEQDFRSDGFQVKPVYGTEEDKTPRKGIYPVRLYVTEEYTGTREAEVACTYVLLDKENTVHGIYAPPPRRLTEPVPAHTFPAAEFSYLSKGKIPLDEELPKEGVKGICVYTVTPV